MNQRFKFRALVYYRNDSGIKVTAPGALRKFLSGLDLRPSGKIGLLSPSCTNLRKPTSIFRLLREKLERHKQSKILKHCRTKCDNSAWVLTPLERMHPSYAAYANLCQYQLNRWKNTRLNHHYNPSSSIYDLHSHLHRYWFCLSSLPYYNYKMNFPDGLCLTL